jgi:hypothetical protein
LSVAVGTEKAKSELNYRSHTLLEIKRLLNRQISVFSGTDFTVDTAGLNGFATLSVAQLLNRKHLLYSMLKVKRSEITMAQRFGAVHLL